MSLYFNYETDPLLACPHCGDKGMVTSFLKRLDAMREAFGRPIRISSGYRCSHYNAQVSHTGRAGPHTTGRAVDIQCHGEDALILTRLAIDHGMTGIGINQKGAYKNRFLHVDDLKIDLRPWLWSY